MKLGKRPSAGQLDRHPIKLAALLPPVLEIPPACDWSTLPDGELPYDMLANDRVGDCVICTGLDAIRTSLAWTAPPAPAFTTADALGLYAKLGGYRPEIPESDRGMFLHDMLVAWQRDGLIGHRILGFAALNPKDWDAVCAGVFYFGGVCGGVMLPLSAESQIAPGIDFRLDTPRTGSDLAGSWGGHAFRIVGYRRADASDPSDIGPSLKVATWGSTRWISRAWWEAYADEAAVPLLVDWLRAGITPEGISEADLWQRLTALGAK